MMLLTYLDINIYNRPFDVQTQARIRLETVACQLIFKMIQTQQIKLAWSFALEYENSLNPFPERRDEIHLLSKLATLIVEPENAILDFAQYLEIEGVKGIDAVHVACAEIAQCHCFITCDDKLLKKVSFLNLTIQLLNPVDFVQRGRL